MSCLMDRVANFERYICWNGSVARYHYILVVLYINKIPWKHLGSPSGRLEIYALSIHHFVQPILNSHEDSWTRSRLCNLLSAITATNKLESPKSTSSIARSSHEWQVTIQAFSGGEGGRVGVVFNYICIFSQCYLPDIAPARVIY